MDSAVPIPHQSERASFLRLQAATSLVQGLGGTGKLWWQWEDPRPVMDKPDMVRVATTGRIRKKGEWMLRLVAPTVIRQTQRRYEELGRRGHGPPVKKLSVASHTPVSGLADVPTSFEPSLITLLWRRLVTVLKTHPGRFGVAALLVVTTVATADELRTSRVQAWLFASIGNEVSFETAPGPSPAIRFPEPGPYDLRLGHARLPDFLARLETSGYVIDRQARSSDRLLSLINGGVYPLYLEKPQAGLQIVDRDDRTLFVARYPERIYQGFDEIPPLVVQTVLFLENRELLDAQTPYRNPAIEWDRTVRAILHLGVRYVDPTFPRLGGSTLATQLEKIRHSPDGVTRSVGDKLRHITTASLRAYLGGRDTLEAQRRIVTDYLNSIPLAALPGHGEVIGLGDGLWAWYGTDFDKVNDLLRRADTLREGMDDVETARVYRRVVSLLVAIRRPSDYLLRDAAVLASLTNDALDALGSAGVVRARLAALARTERPQLRRTVHLPEVSFFDRNRKPASAIRASLSATLGLDTVYELDRTDVTVTTTLDLVGQQTVAERLKRLADPAYAASAGLTGDRLLGGADPASVVYSLVLYERDGDANLVRIQADSLDSAARRQRRDKTRAGVDGQAAHAGLLSRDCRDAPRRSCRPPALGDRRGFGRSGGPVDAPDAGPSSPTPRHRALRHAGGRTRTQILGQPGRAFCHGRRRAYVWELRLG